MKNKKKLSLIEVGLKIYEILGPKYKLYSLFILATTMISGFLDVLGLAVLLPIIYLINDPSKISENFFFSQIQNLTNINNPDHFILFCLFLILFTFIFKNSLILLFLRLQYNFTKNISIQITQKEFKKYFNRDYEYFSNTNSNIITRDIIIIPHDFSANILTPYFLLLTEFFIIFFIIIGILIIDYKVVVLLSLILLPLLFVLNKYTKSKIVEWGNQKNDTNPKTFKLVFETIYAYIDVKLFQREQHFVNLSETVLDKYYSLIQKIKLVQNVPIRIVEVATVIGIILLYFYVVFITKNQSGMIQFLVLFATAAYRILPSVNRILNAQMTINSSAYVFETLSGSSLSDPDNFETTEAKLPLDFTEKILLDNISFKYKNSDKLSLKNINLKINPGDIVGLIGESGSGKTTLGKLLLGFLEPQSGLLKIDNKIVDKSNLKEWQKSIGYVQQDFYLLADSLLENIAFGEKKENIDIEKINAVVKQVKLDKVINELPNGINTAVGEFGKFFSGGQRQRLAIARALYKDAKFLVFDEATSALDNQTEEDIMDTLYEITKQKLTVVIIAHRLTTLKKCNRIIRMSEGQIVEETTYSKLNLQ